MLTPVHPTHILVVDDEYGIRYFMERFLTREGFQVTTVSSGEEALERLAEHEFDLVLLDLKMKGVGGLEVLADLSKRWPATVVIVLTAHATLESAVDALRRGAHDYLFKPCRTLDLRESIRTGLIKRQQQLQLLRAKVHSVESAAPTAAQPAGPTSAEQPGRFWQHSGLIVDSIRHIITVDGTLLELSPTEFDLLAYLVSEAPRVVSSQELIREVQGYESNSLDAETIRSHMYHIRRKIRAATERPLVRTVRGIGYTLSE